MSELSYYYRFYLSRALEHAGRGNVYLTQLASWYSIVDLGLSTWAETPEPARSDGHAWSASLNYDLLTIVQEFSMHTGLQEGPHRATPGRITSIHRVHATPERYD